MRKIILQILVLFISPFAFAQEWSTVTFPSGGRLSCPQVEAVTQVKEEVASAQLIVQTFPNRIKAAADESMLSRVIADQVRNDSSSIVAVRSGPDDVGGINLRIAIEHPSFKSPLFDEVLKKSGFLPANIYIQPDSGCVLTAK